jgi:hypothetical protein
MASKNDSDIAISYYIEEIENEHEDEEQTNIFNIEEMLKEIETNELKDELTIPHMINYHDNFTVKELLLICEYYGFSKEIKNNKFNKEQIINYLVDFENNENNSEIVFKRQNMWFYINELKADKFMKKFVIWK